VSAGAHLRDRLAAGGYHQRRARDRSRRRLHEKSIGCSLDRAGFDAQLQLAARLREAVEQHGDDLPRRAVAEQLAERLLVIRDAARLHPRDEVMLGKTLERRYAEMRIARDELFRRAVEIGEIAPPAAGDADLLRRFFGMVDDEHATPAPRRLDAAHQA